MFSVMSALEMKLGNIFCHSPRTKKRGLDGRVDNDKQLNMMLEVFEFDLYELNSSLI